jgi:hypothetical protein
VKKISFTEFVKYFGCLTALTMIIALAAPRAQAGYYEGETGTAAITATDGQTGLAYGGELAYTGTYTTSFMPTGVSTTDYMYSECMYDGPGGDIGLGQPFPAKVFNIDQAAINSSQFPTVSLESFEAAVVIAAAKFSMSATDPNETIYEQAVWDLTYPGSVPVTPQIQSAIDYGYANVATTNFSLYQLIEPTTDLGQPQLILASPEPASLAMLLGGLLLMAMKVMSKMRQARVLKSAPVSIQTTEA